VRRFRMGARAFPQIRNDAINRNKSQPPRHTPHIEFCVVERSFDFGHARCATAIPEGSSMAQPARYNPTVRPLLRARKMQRSLPASVLPQSLLPLLQSAELANLTVVGAQLERFVANASTLALLLNPADTDSESFFYASSWPPIKLEAQRQILAWQGILDRLPQVCHAYTQLTVSSDQPNSVTKVLRDTIADASRLLGHRDDVPRGLLIGSRSEADRRVGAAVWASRLSQDRRVAAPGRLASQ